MLWCLEVLVGGARVLLADAGDIVVLTRRNTLLSFLGMGVSLVLAWGRELLGWDGANVD